MTLVHMTSGKRMRVAHRGSCEVRDLITILNCLKVRLQELDFHICTPIEGGVSQW